MKGTEGFMARVQVVVLIISKGKTLPFLPSSLPSSLLPDRDAMSVTASSCCLESALMDDALCRKLK